MSGSSTAVSRQDTGRMAEAAVAQALDDLGFAVTNLHELVGNCPFADLLARRDDARLMIQVNGTTTSAGKFGTPPHRVRALQRLSTELGCQAVYAFVQLVAGSTKLRFATAAEVATLADIDETEYKGKNRYHVTIEQFDVDIRGFDRVLATS